MDPAAEALCAVFLVLFFCFCCCLNSILLHGIDQLERGAGRSGMTRESLRGIQEELKRVGEKLERAVARPSFPMPTMTHLDLCV